MYRLNLCIDIDGTVTGAYDWIPRVNNYFKTNITPRDVKVYEIHEVLGVESRIYNEFYYLYGVLLHAEATIREGVKEVLHRLHQQHNIHFVTAREERMSKVTYKWFENHQIPFHSISLLGSHNKVSRGKELSCHIFIEDRYENAIQLALAGFKVLLIDCYYNQDPLLSNITRVTNWFEIEDIITAEVSTRSLKIAT